MVLQNYKIRNHARISFSLIVQGFQFQASTTSENLKLVREGDENYVFIGEMPMLKYVANQPPCSLYVGQDPNSLQPQRGYAIAVNKV